MITETITEDYPDLVERKSDLNVLIRNLVTGHKYDTAIDYTNKWREARGYEPYFYEETDIPIEPPEEELADERLNN